MKLFKGAFPILLMLLAFQSAAWASEEKQLIPVDSQQARTLFCQKLLTQMYSENSAFAQIVRIDAETEQQIMKELEKEGYSNDDAARFLILWRNTDLLDFGVLHQVAADEILRIYPASKEEIRSFLESFEMLSASKKEEFLNRVVARINEIAGDEIGFEALFAINRRASEFNLNPDQFREFIRNWRKLYKDDPNEAKILIFMNLIGNPEKVIENVERRRSLRTWLRAKLRRIGAVFKRKPKVLQPQALPATHERETLSLPSGDSSPVVLAKAEVEALKNNFKGPGIALMEGGSFQDSFNRMVELIERNIDVADNDYALWVAQTIFNHHYMDSASSFMIYRPRITELLISKLETKTFHSEHLKAFQEILKVVEKRRTANLLAYTNGTASEADYKAYDNVLADALARLKALEAKAAAQP